MFPNLNAELARNNMTKQQLAKVMNISVNAMYLRMLGKVEFKQSECAFLCELFQRDFSYLFEKEVS